MRAAVGPDVTLRLDANQGWTPDQAIRLIGALEDAGADIELVEQPVPAADLDGLARVTAAVETPVMADEAVFSLADLTAVIERGAATLVNVKLAKAGGLAPAREQLALAAAHGIGTMVGSMMETGIGVAAAGSLVAAVGTTVVCDLDAGLVAGRRRRSGLVRRRCAAPGRLLRPRARSGNGVTVVAVPLTDILADRGSGERVTQALLGEPVLVLEEHGVEVRAGEEAGVEERPIPRAATGPGRGGTSPQPPEGETRSSPHNPSG